MDDRTWDGLVEAAKAAHTAMLAEGGFVSAPALFPLVDGRLIGWVRPTGAGGG